MRYIIARYRMSPVDAPNTAQEVLVPHRILVQSPDDFLIDQYHLNPDVVAKAADNTCLLRSRIASQVMS